MKDETDPALRAIASLIEAIYPECTVAMAAIGEHGEEIAAVWKWKGERDWIPLTDVMKEIGAAIRVGLPEKVEMPN